MKWDLWGQVGPKCRHTEVKRSWQQSRAPTRWKVSAATSSTGLDHSCKVWSYVKCQSVRWRKVLIWSIANYRLLEYWLTVKLEEVRTLEVGWPFGVAYGRAPRREQNELQPCTSFCDGQWYEALNFRTSLVWRWDLEGKVSNPDGDRSK